MGEGYFHAIQNDLEDLLLELSQQCLRIKAGLGETQRTGAIFASHPVATDLESILWLRDYGLQQRDPDLRERALRVYFTCVSQFLRLDLILREEAFAEFSVKAAITLNGQKVALAEIERFLIEEPSFDNREALIQGMRPLFAKASILKQAMLEGASGVLRDDFGYAHLLEFYEKKKGYDLEWVRKRSQWLLQATERVYQDLIPGWVESIVGIPFKEVSHLHMLRILNQEGCGIFPLERGLFSFLYGILRSMGFVDPLQKRIHLDFESRPGKTFASRCVPLRVPHEIHVILNPTGRLTDVETALHEMGHALHMANTDPSLPYPYRHLPRCFSLTETYGFLMEHLAMEPSVLSDFMNIPPKEAERICGEKALKRLYVIRRYAGKLLFETEYLRRGELEDWSHYPQWMHLATGLLYKEEESLLDLEEELYCADYLRAWAGEVALRKHLEGQLGKKWFRNEDTFAFLRELWSKGESLDLEALLLELHCGPLSFESLAQDVCDGLAM